MSRAAPRAMYRVPRVAMKGATRNLVMTRPLTAPTAVPSSSATMTTTRTEG